MPQRERTRPPTKAGGRDVATATEQTPHELQLISAKATAKSLGISARHLYSLTASGELAVVRIGRMLRYRLADVERFIANNSRKGGSHG